MPPLPPPLQSTWDIQVIPIPLAVSVLLPVCILLGVLQAQLVADLKCLPHSPDNAHGLALRWVKRGECNLSSPAWCPPQPGTALRGLCALPQGLSTATGTRAQITTVLWAACCSAVPQGPAPAAPPRSPTAG